MNETWRFILRGAAFLMILNTGVQICIILREILVTLKGRRW